MFRSVGRSRVTLQALASVHPNVSSFPRNVVIRSKNLISKINKRDFASKGEKTPNATPPPPPPSSEGGNGMWILLTAALGGATYYFWEDITKTLGLKKDSPIVTETDKGAVKNVSEAKQVIKSVEEKVIPTEKIPKIEVKETNEIKQVEKAVNEVAKKDAEKSKEVDWKLVRAEIVKLLDDEKYDDGSYGPVFVRLAWHNAGTYDKNTGKGGSEGAGMRFSNEGKWAANAGLDIARARLESVKKKFPQVTYSDLWSFAGTVAIEEMGGPKMNWRPGRKDFNEKEHILGNGLLPDADGRSFKVDPQNHVREIFGRMGFNDQEMVALIGGHAIGRCHTDRSGFWGPWTHAPTTFSNEFFRLLLEEKWSKKKTHQGKEWKGPEQYENPAGDLMMLPTDLCLVWDPKFKKYVEMYAKDEQKFFKDFGAAWIKLNENGVKKFHGWRRYIFFGPRE